MQMEIISPKEGDFLTEIKWNNTELLEAVQKKSAEYASVVYSGDGWIKTAKSDRADLNKLRSAIETERKRIKKQCMAPYEAFEAQVKEVLKPLDEAIASIDRQIKNADEAYREQKRKDIREAFDAQGFQEFVELEMIWNDKWLNKSYSMEQIKQDLAGRMYDIGRSVLAIHQLEEYKFEAMEHFKMTLDLPGALREAQRLVDLQKRKAEAAAAEAEEKNRREEERRAREALEAAAHKEMPEQADAPVRAPEQEAPSAAPTAAEEPEIFQVDFRVYATREQIRMLADFLKANRIKYGKVR